MWSWASGWLTKVCNVEAYLDCGILIQFHLVVEQYRLLHGMLQVIQEVNSVTGLPICNENTCPTMSAGRYVDMAG